MSAWAKTLLRRRLGGPFWVLRRAHGFRRSALCPPWQRRPGSSDGRRADHALCVGVRQQAQPRAHATSPSTSPRRPSKARGACTQFAILHMSSNRRAAQQHTGSFPAFLTFTLSQFSSIVCTSSNRTAAQDTDDRFAVGRLLVIVSACLRRRFVGTVGRFLIVLPLSTGGPLRVSYVQSSSV